MEIPNKSEVIESINYISDKQNDKQNTINIINWNTFNTLKQKEKTDKYYSQNENKSITENIFFQSNSNLRYIFIKSDNLNILDISNFSLINQTKPDEFHKILKEIYIKEINDHDIAINLVNMDYNKNFIVYVKNNGECSILNQKSLGYKELFKDIKEIQNSYKEIIDSVFKNPSPNNIDYHNLDFTNSIKLGGVLNKKYLKKVSCGEKHCLFLTHAGMAFSIGDNTFGQLGIGNNNYQREPIMITSLLNYRITDLNSGKYHNVATGILRDNSNSKMKLEENITNKEKENYLFTWGDNRFGQLGVDFTNNKNNQRIIRKSVDLDNLYKNMTHNEAQNHYQSMNNFNLLENYIPYLNSPHILQVFNDNLISTIETGDFHNVILLSEGKAFAFGSNLENQILNVIGDSEKNINQGIINTIDEAYSTFNENQDNTIIKNLYRDIFLNNNYKSQHDIKKLYTIPQKVQIPCKREKTNIQLIKINSNSTLYFYNDNIIYLTGRIVENNPILKYHFIRVIENEEENYSHELNNKSKQIDFSKSLNDVQYQKSTDQIIPINTNDKNSDCILNLYHFVFILNDDNFIILYEPICTYSDDISYSKNSNSLEKIEQKLQTKTLKIEFLPIFEFEKNFLNNSFIPEERKPIDSIIKENSSNLNMSVNQSLEDNNLRKSTNNNNRLNRGSNKIKIKLSYNEIENENNSVSEDKTSNISNSLLTAGNFGNYYSDNIFNNDKGSLEEDYSKDLFTENATNDEIFNNSFNFEHSIEELRNYINLVGISLLDNGVSKLVSFRPKNLPRKSPEEETYHRKLVEENRKNYMKYIKEKQEQEKKQKAVEEKKKQKAKKLYTTWINDILPQWYKIKDDVNYLRKYFYEGVPISLRGTVWLLCIGNNFSITREYYEIEVKKAINYLISINRKDDNKGDENTEEGENINDNFSNKFHKYNIQIINKENSISFIDLDIDRTFPYLGIFKHNSPLSEDLREILRAFVVSRPDIGYVQGVSYIAGMLILNMDKYQAFVALMNIILNHNILPFYRFEENQIRKRLQIFKQVFYYNLPELCDHFESIDLLPETYMIEWIMTIFAKNVNIDFAARIWDIYMIDGFKVIYQTAISKYISSYLLVILSHFERRFMEMEFEDIVKTLKNLNNINFDEEQIIDLIKKVSFPEWVSNEILKLNYEYIPLEINQYK